MTIQQVLDQFLSSRCVFRMVGVGMLQPFEQWGIVRFAQRVSEGVQCRLIQWRIGQQVFHRPGDGLVAVLFLDKGVEVREAVGVEQSETGKMTGLAKLLGCRREQQYTAGMCGQLFDHTVFGTGLLRGPLQVVGLVNHQQIPVTFYSLLRALRVRAQEFQGAQHQLLALKRVFLFTACGNGLAAFLVKDAEVQVEAAQHFHQPLVQQTFRHHNQYPSGAFGQQLVVQDQARFDGFPEADFVSQQHTRGVAVGDFVGDIQLVGDQAGTAAGQAVQVGMGQSVQLL